MNITWIHKGAKVKDRFGEWFILACPDSVNERVGEIQITVSSGDNPERDIWLLDFLRDFEPTNGQTHWDGVKFEPVECFVGIVKVGILSDSPPLT